MICFRKALVSWYHIEAPVLLGVTDPKYLVILSTAENGPKQNKINKKNKLFKGVH